MAKPRASVDIGIPGHKIDPNFARCKQCKRRVGADKLCKITTQTRGRDSSKFVCGDCAWEILKSWKLPPTVLASSARQLQIRNT